MKDESVDRAVAIVGVAAIMPDAPDAATFWQNIQDGRYSISEVTPDRWDPALYYDPDPQAPDKTLLEDRWLGPGLRMGPAGMEAPDPAAGRATPWTTPRSGRSTWPGPRWSTTAGPSARSTTSEPRW